MNEMRKWPESFDFLRNESQTKSETKITELFEWQTRQILELNEFKNSSVVKIRKHFLDAGEKESERKMQRKEAGKGIK